MAGDAIYVGSAFKEGMQPLEQNNTKGITRAFDVKTGKLIWTFHNIHKKVEFGYDSWENGSVFISSAKHRHLGQHHRRSGEQHRLFADRRPTLR